MQKHNIAGISCNQCKLDQALALIKADPASCHRHLVQTIAAWEASLATAHSDLADAATNAARANISTERRASYQARCERRARKAICLAEQRIAEARTELATISASAGAEAVRREREIPLKHWSEYYPLTKEHGSIKRWLYEWYHNIKWKLSNDK